MNKQLPVFTFIQQQLQQQVPVMLLYVVQSLGSSPGREGFCMAVAADAGNVGSIGGGIMEHKFVQLAIAKLKAGEVADGLYRQVHNKSATADQSGMICSGEQTLLLKTILSIHLDVITAIVNALSSAKKGLLQMAPGTISFNMVGNNNPVGLATVADSYTYKQLIGELNSLFIIGGGHCALALSAVMQPLNFYITLFDDRHSLSTFNQNHFAHKKILVNDYTDLQTLIEPSTNMYIIVMTVGYRTDDIAIRSLRHHPFRYFGILGSQKKIEKMLDIYRSEGWPEQWFTNISAPAGFSIKSQTPEEIAISIAAQIILIKNTV